MSKLPRLHLADKWGITDKWGIDKITGKTEASAEDEMAAQAALDAANAKEHPVMPIADDEAVRKAKRKSLQQQRARQGRASTFMSSEDALGGA
jgi:hypothetical protein